MHCSACLGWRKQLLGVAPGKDSPLQREPCQLQDGVQPGACGELDRNAAGCPGSAVAFPRARAVITHSTGTLWDPAAAPALASPWHPERQYLLPGAELCSTVQKMGSCLPLLRTQLKSCSCKKPVFSKHWGSAFNCWLWF